MKDMLEERRRALENVFFERYNRKLLEQIREKHQHELDRDRLAEVYGVTDEEFLDLLLVQGIKAESLAALVLVPLVVVAWSDREMSPEEIRVILEAADDLGIKEGTPAIKLLNYWLVHPPTSKLIDTWTAYTNTLCSRLKPDNRKRFADNILHWATEVARAAGGVLGGVGPKICKKEREALSRLAEAFDA